MRPSHWPVWQQGLLALMVLAPLFFLSYGAANHWAAGQPDVPSVVFDWERHIPLIPWTILPYWSIDLFYGLSLLVADRTPLLWRQVMRLLTAQLLCVVSFFLWPLRFSTPRPPLEGWEGILFDALAGFDLPYNQAPSLHIVLLLILWDFYRRKVGGWLRLGVHAWSLLIGVSVLTTYQHHAIDVPAGLLVGALCMWLWPLEGDVPWRIEGARRVHLRPAGVYLAAAIALAALALHGGHLWSRAAWVLWWPALSLGLVAIAYLGWGAGAFQKRSAGRHVLASRCLLAPHRVMAWLNARAWTARHNSTDEVCDGVWVGRLPMPWEADHGRFARVLDLTAELSCRHPGLHAMPMLDLVPPHPAQLRRAAQVVERWRRESREPVLVCCALGYSRSAAVVLTWLCLSGRAAFVDEAVGLLRRQRPQVVLSAGTLAAVEQALIHTEAQA